MEPHTAEIWKSGHTYSNPIVLLNSRTNECFTFTELPRSKFTACPTCSDIFQSSKQSSNPKLIGLFFHVSVKRDPWALASSFETCHCRCDRLYVPALSTDKIELHIKDMKSVVRGGQKNFKHWNLLAVIMSDYSFIATRNSHAKTQEISGSHPSRRWARGNKTFEFLSKHKWK